MLSAFTPLAAESQVAVKQTWVDDREMNFSVDQVKIAFVQGDAIELTESVFRLGNHPARLWARLHLMNPEEEEATLRLLVGVPYSRLLRASLYPEGLLSTASHVLIEEKETRVFADRNNSFRLLHSDVFVLAPGARADILIETLVEGPSYLPFSVMTDDEFERTQLVDSVFGALFYGFSITLGLLFLLFALAVRHPIAMLYAGLFLLGIVVMLDIDGYAFQWLWPDYPRWNHVSPLLILPLLNGLGYFIIYQLLHSSDPEKYQRIKQLVLGLVLISLLLPLLVFYLPQSALIQAENLLSIPAFLGQPLAFVTWFYRGRRSYLSATALLGVGGVVLVLVSTVFIDYGLPKWLIEHVHHLAYGVVGLMVMSIITVHLMGLYKDQQATLKRELLLAQQNARVSQNLLQAEKNYAQAQRLASRHRQQLASASHDLRQPIMSLRASVDAISHAQEPNVRQQLQDAFDYLEQLCNRHLRHTKPDGFQDKTEQHVYAEPEKEIYPISLVLNTVQRMFAKEAASRNIELRLVDCQLQLNIEPLVMMRILSNLVSNAIKHYPAHTSHHSRARVLMGCRRAGDAMHILVCDNGAGMTETQLQALQQPYQKGEDSEGEGLGLAIVWQLATENQLEISVRSVKGQGSCFHVRVPACH